MHLTLSSLAAAALTFALAGCAAHDTDPPPGTDDEQSPVGADGPDAADAGKRDAGSRPQTGDKDSGGAPGVVTQDRPDLTVGDVMGCKGKSVSAPPSTTSKVDIVWVIDASGSMLDEYIKVGQNLTKFAEDIAAASVDLRIVMLTQSPSIPVICPVTPPDPLSGTPLAMDARYRFIQTPVDSNNLLESAISRFPMYQDFLRPDAALNFVFLTDDESRYNALPSAAERAAAFEKDMRALANKGFTAHTISSPGPSPCRSDACMPDPNTGICVFVMLGCGASAVGETYYALADSTGGLKSSICESDWSSIFEPLTAAVVQSAPLPCEYEIPEPPTGDTLDPTQVNLGWEPASGSGQKLFKKASDQSACGDELAWHYDDESRPTQVVLCPAACSEVANGGKLDIAFGCQTIPLI
jgi:hypothetical protein